MQVKLSVGLEALNASFTVFGIGIAHAFDVVVRPVRKGDVSVRVGLFLDGRIAFDSAILFDGAIAFVVQAGQLTSPPYAAWSISPKVPFQKNGALYSFAVVHKVR